jgi:hypothetical protein
VCNKINNWKQPSESDNRSSTSKLEKIPFDLTLRVLLLGLLEKPFAYGSPNEVQEPAGTCVTRRILHMANKLSCTTP